MRQRHLIAVLFLTSFWAACGSSSSTTTYTVGGTLSGLSGTVVLQNNTANDLSLTADGSFTFTTALADAATYAVTVLTQPSGQTCTVSSGSGTIASANVTNVTVACASSSTPTISSVTGISSGTSTSATIATTGTTAISAFASNPLTITFSTAMDTSTVTTSNITLSCGGTAQTITIANSDSSTNMTFTVTPSANLTQVTSCTLTIGTGVQSSTGAALASAATYVYTTGCTVNDNFATNTVTGGCWTPYSGNDGTISVTGGTLVETITTTEGVISEQKTITPGGSMVAIVSIPTFSGIENGGGAMTSMCALFVGDSSSETVISIGIERSDFGDLKVNVVTSATVATADLGVNGTSSSALSGTLYFKIVQVSDTTFTAHYSLDGSSYTQVGGTITGGVVLGSAPIISLFAANHVADTTTSCSFANFSLTGATVSGQD